MSSRAFRALAYGASFRRPSATALRTSESIFPGLLGTRPSPGRRRQMRKFTPRAPVNKYPVSRSRVGPITRVPDHAKPDR